MKLHISLVKATLISSNIQPEYYDVKCRRNQEILQVFAAWYEKNQDECSKEDKEEILECISLDLFKPSELFKIVKPSSLYPDEEIDKRILDHLHEMEDRIARYENWDD